MYNLVTEVLSLVHGTSATHLNCSKLTQLLCHIESCIDALSVEYPCTVIALAGVFNTLDNFDIISRSSLSPIVDQPTRGENYLDRIYISNLCYTNVKVVVSTVNELS